MTKNTNRKKYTKEVDKEIISKGKDVVGDFNRAEALTLPAKTGNKLISIRVPIDLLKRLRRRADAMGDIGYQTLIKIYIAAGLHKDEQEKMPEAPFPQAHKKLRAA